MSRPATPTPSPGALRMRQLQQRRAKGLQQLPQPWDWITAAQARDLVTNAFRAASWQCRDPETEPEHFGDALIEAFEVLVAAKASREGHGIRAEHFDQVADRMLADVPHYWRHQYPRFGVLDQSPAEPPQPPLRVRRPPKPKAVPEVASEPCPPASIEIKPDLASAWLFGGRSEAEGGGEAPLQNGARIE